jgi:SpoVK/Ycf46/Vps4 family AAA+-type ATPase
MLKKTAGRQRIKAAAEWEWPRRYRVWEANRKIFLYPENWIEPDLRSPTASRAVLRKAVAFLRAKCGVGTKGERAAKPVPRKSACLLLTGKNRTGALIAAQTLARDLGRDLYRVDLGDVVSKYIGETEKNLRRVFDAVGKSGAILFFDEADALFGKRTEVKDSHDRYANIEINYLLQRIEDYADIVILAGSRRKNDIDEAFLRRLRYVLSIPSTG